MTFGADSLGRSIVRQRTDEFQRRQQTHDNSSRLATNLFTHTTRGAGQLVTGILNFDCVYVEEPVFTSGAAIVTVPDQKHWHLPLVTAGIYRWVKKPQHPPTAHVDSAATTAAGAGISSPDDKTPQFYTGAYLFFVVRVDPNLPVRTDGSNLAFLQAQLLNYETGSADYLNAQKLIAEANESIYLTAHPAKVVLHHHLVFTGIAMKKLADEVTALGDDKTVTPLKPGDS